MNRIEWLTVGEAARYLGVSEPTLRKWTDAGTIDAFRTPGGHRRYRIEELRNFHEGHAAAIEPTQPKEHTR